MTARHSPIPGAPGFPTGATGWSRRRLLAAGGTAVAAVAGLGVAGCSGGREETNTAARNSAATLPTYRPVQLVEPDLPGDEIVMSGYYAYPRDPAPVFESPPCEGLGSVSIMYGSFVPTPPGPDANAFYRRLQERLGCELEITFVPDTDYGTKFSTMLAGGQLPEVMTFPLPTPNQPQVMDKLFTDLGPYLAGDAALDFPHLAAIPTASWKPTVSNGTVFAVPQPRALTNATLFTRLDLIETAGADPEPTDYDGLVELFTAVTDPKARRWACANFTRMLDHVRMMLGAPNRWTEEGGTFTNALADERSRQAVDRVKQLLDAGLFHPDSASLSYTRVRELFYAGTVAVTSDGYAAWDLFARQLGGGSEAVAKLGLMIEPQSDGGGDARHFAGTGFQGITVIRKSDDEQRTRQILALLDFLATPIGSREHLERKYGVPEVDHVWNGDVPALTDQGSRDFLDLQYIADSQTTIGPGPREAVDRQFAYHRRATADLVLDPSVGLYSDTYSREGSKLNTLLGDAQTEVILGRQPITHLEEAYQQWRTQGGDRIAAEYAESLAAAG